MVAGPHRSGYDVVVVGAGIVGLACAWRAAERGLSVLVVDRDGETRGASWAAAGMLAPVTEAAFGEEPLARLAVAGAAEWPGFRAELEERAGRDTGYRESGALLVAKDRDDAEELHRLLAFQRALGLEAEWVASRECRRLEPGLSPAVAGAILARAERHVDPRAVILALAAALERAGGKRVAGEARLRVDPGGRACGVDIAGHGPVDAGAVVAAPGAVAGALEGVPAGHRPPVRPVKGQILRLRAGSPPAERVIRGLRCYIVPRSSGEVIVGATVEDRGHDSSVTAGGVFGLLEAARELLPDVDELELVEARAGLRPGTPDNGPIVGPGSVGGLVWATGHHRGGVLLAPLTARAVVDAIVGQPLPEALRPFGPERFERPTGRPAASATSPALEVPAR